jgi:hypothetical protein
MQITYVATYTRSGVCCSLTKINFTGPEGNGQRSNSVTSVCVPGWEDVVRELTGSLTHDWHGDITV